MKISRRNFLKGSVTTLFLAGFNLPVYSNSKKKNLVVIMLRGGMDGLCAVPVIGDKDFEKRRKNFPCEYIQGMCTIKVTEKNCSGGLPEAYCERKLNRKE